MDCGKVGCCDDSPNRHPSRHARLVWHPSIKSAELFSIERYEEVIDASLRGLADRAGRRRSSRARGPALLSRIDTTVDGRPGT
jgi:hypothetical protein